MFNTILINSYGRHSKSINPEECGQCISSFDIAVRPILSMLICRPVCGRCKTGQLVPQFQSRAAPKTPKPKADSQNAAARSRGASTTFPAPKFALDADLDLGCSSGCGGRPCPYPDSPLHIPGAFPSPVAPPKARARAFVELSEGEESEVEFLADTLKTVRVSAECMS